MSATQGPSGAARIEDTVKDFWATRPRRPRRGRKVAGVASGIANRYRIDPVLVRVGFVVAAIYGGAGVLMYLLGWLFLPEQDDEVSPAESLFGKGRSSTSSGFTILLGIFMVPVAGWFFSGSFTGEFSSWTSLLVVGGLLYLLHQTRGSVVPLTPSAPATPQPTMPVYSPTPAQPAATMPFVPQAAPTVNVPPPAPTVNMPPPVQPMATTPLGAVPPVQPEPRTNPPAWDPLGAAPFAWDLPEPTTPEPEEPKPPKRRKPRVGTATLGIALVAVASLAIVANAPWAAGGWATPQHIVGVVLAIVGLGLVAGAFLRAGRGLIALAVPLSVVGMGLTAVSPGGDYHGMGDLTASPVTLDSVLPQYERSVGTVELDLTGLPEEPPAPSAEGPVSPVDFAVVTGAHTNIGNVEITVPKNADVTFNCVSDLGNTDCLNMSNSGPSSSVQGVDYGEDGPGGLKIDLTASADTGNVEVRRG